MKPPVFQYHAPSSTEEVLDLLAELGSEAKVIAGGQSLMPMLNMRLATPAHLIDINRVFGLDSLEIDEERVRIGATIRQRRVERSDEIRTAVPLLSEAARHIGHPIIRNRGTVVGSLAHADPAAELPAVFALLGGTAHAAGKQGQRDIPVEEFLTGPFDTALRPDEFLTAVTAPVMTPGAGVSFIELARRHGDFALCAVGAVVENGSGRLAFAGVGEVPHVAELGGALEDGVEAAVEEAVRGLEPPADIHASSDYRRHLARVLGIRALVEASDRSDRSTETDGTRRG